MKYEKAMVTIINMGKEDILTCSGDEPSNNCAGKNWWAGWWSWMSWFKPQKPSNPFGGRTYGGGGWFGHW